MQVSQIRELTMDEVNSVTGGDFVLGGVAVTGVAAGLEVAAAGTAVAAAFGAGWAVGSAFNSTWKFFSGHSLGVDIYNFFNS